MTGSMGDAFKKAGIKVGGGRGSRGPGKGPPPTRGLPPGYLDGGYFDEKGNVRRELIIDWARDIAQQFKAEGLNPSAIRKFFHMARAIQSSPDFERDFSRVRERIYKFEPLAAYQVARKVVPRIFEDFIKRNILRAAEDAKSFSEGFIQHFMCILAYFVGFGGEKGGRR